MTNQNYGAIPVTQQDIFTEEPLIYGSFWNRFFAVILDGLILAIPSFMLTYFIDGAMGNVLNIVMYWLYDAILESGPQQATFGKRALGLRVVTTEGHPITFGQATGRHFGKFISTIILFIGYFMMLWNDKRQTLHDQMAGTLIVK